MVVKFLYYARVLDTTTPVVLNSIVAEQVKITQVTANMVVQFIKYAATHSEFIIRYHYSITVLRIHSGASFLSDPGSKSRAVRFHYLSKKSDDPSKPLENQPPTSGLIHVECTTINNILASTMEAELEDLFVNCQKGAATHEHIPHINCPQTNTHPRCHRHIVSWRIYQLQHPLNEIMCNQCEILLI